MGVRPTELFRLLGTIAIDNERANRAIDETSEHANEASNETQEAFAKIGGAAGAIVKGIATAGAVLGGAWIAAIEGSREYRTEMGKLDTAFQTAGFSSETAKKTYSDLNSVLGDSGQATEAAQMLAMLADNEKDLASWTDICTGVYARMGEALPIEELIASSNETAKSGVLTGGLVDGLIQAGHSEEEFQKKLDACSSEQERQKLIMDTLNGSYSEASEQYKKTNKDVIAANKAQEKLTDAFAEFGRIGEPILTAIKDKVADMVSAAVPHLENFVNKVKDIIQWVKENGDTVHTWVGVIIGAGAAIGTFLLILNWGTIMTAAANAVKVVRTAILAMNAAILANPIALIVAAIVGLVAGFIYLWNNVDGFRNFWIKAWDTIKKAAVAAWNGVKSVWNGAKAFFSSVWQGISGVFANIGGWFKSKFQSAWSSIKSVFSGWGSFFSGLWSQIKSKFSSLGSSLGTSMGNAVKSGLNRVLSTIESAINKGIGLINSAIRLANKLPGIKVGTVGKIYLPRLARGGVLERGQVGILEGSGAEAVVPLEHNKAWLSRVAEDLNELQLQSSPATVDTDRIITMLQHIADLIARQSGMKVVLESGALVGELTPAIDRQLANRWSHAQRGNSR